MSAAEGGGRTAVVTGATSGIGKAIALRLAEAGVRTILVARSAERGEAARAEIASRSNNPHVSVVLADLASLASIREGAARIRERAPRVDILVNQAGLVENERKLTVDGHETMFAVNHLAYFLLTNLLVGELARGSARVLNVTGGIEAAGTIDFDDLMHAERFGWFEALAQSKLSNVLFTYEAARRFAARGVTVNCLNPGGVKTDLGRNTTGIPRLLMQVGRLVFRDAEKAATGFVTPLLSPEFAGTTGKYLGPDGRTEARSSPRSHDAELAAKLWAVSVRLTGLDASGRTDAPPVTAVA